MITKGGKCIRTFYSKCINLTCLVHAFYRILVEACDKFSDVDKVIASVKNVFGKSLLIGKHFAIFLFIYLNFNAFK